MRITITTKTVIVACGAVLALLFVYGLGRDAGSGAAIADLEGMQARIMEGISDVTDEMTCSSERSVEIIGDEERRCAESKERWTANRGSPAGMRLLEDSCPLVTNMANRQLSNEGMSLLPLEFVASQVATAVKEAAGL